MAARLKNITTADAYTADTTVQMAETERILLQIANAGVYYQLDTSPRGDGAWDQESFLLPCMGTLPRRCSGIRVRSALAGQPAQVSADLLNLADLGGAEGGGISPFLASVSAAGGFDAGTVNNLVPISDITLPAASSGIDVSLIVASFAHLRIELIGRGDAALSNVQLWLRYNNDSGANYDIQYVAGNAAAAAAGEALAQTKAWVGALPAATAPVSVYGSTVIDIPGYSGVSGEKVGSSQSSLKTGVASGGLNTYAFSHWWRNPNAIDRITLTPSSGNFAGGLRCTIYALKGA